MFAGAMVEVLLNDGFIGIIEFCSRRFPFPQWLVMTRWTNFTAAYSAYSFRVTAVPRNVKPNVSFKNEREHFPFIFIGSLPRTGS